MKYLRDYQEPQQSDFLKTHGCFFAFSNAQFDEQCEEGIEYTNIGGGLLCPKSKAKAVIEGINDIYNNAIQQDLKENGKTAIIRRELYNHECFYTGDYSPVLDVLKPYSITEAEISQVFYRHQS